MHTSPARFFIYFCSCLNFSIFMHSALWCTASSAVYIYMVHIAEMDHPLTFHRLIIITVIKV